MSYSHLVRVLIAIAILLTVMGCKSRSHTSSNTTISQRFLGNFAGLTGLAFEGVVDAAYTPENTFEGQRLLMIVEQTTADGARIKLRVGEDRSRTWVLTIEPSGLLRLRHDHRHPDGTPHELTDYGGIASPNGTETRQIFPADANTASMLPAATTNIWTMEFNHGNRTFMYDLTRDGQPRFRAVFDLTKVAKIEGNELH